MADNLYHDRDRRAAERALRLNAWLNRYWYILPGSMAVLIGVGIFL